MPLPSWPAVNNRPQRDGYKLDRFLPPLATPMEGGNTRERPRPGDNVGTLSQVIWMPVAQHDVFVAWVRDTLNNGTARFTASVWLGSSYQTKTCKFDKDGHPSYANVGPTWVAVTMKLLVFDL